MNAISPLEPITTAEEAMRSYEELLAVADAFNEDTHPGEINEIVLAAEFLDGIAKGKIMRRVKERTKTPLYLLKPPASDDKKVVDHRALANAVIETIGHENIIESGGFTWLWDKCGLWRKVHEDRTIKQLVMDTLGEGEAFRSSVDGVTDVLRTVALKDRHKFDIAAPNSVNTRSGEVELVDGQFVMKPHTRENYRTTQIPVEFNPEATAPRFEQFLREVFPGERGEDDQRAVLEMIGYTLMSHCKHERFCLLIGNGSNGKSVLLRVISDLLGSESVSAVQPSEFGNKFQRGHLHCKLANIVTELSEGAVIDDGALKSIVSGETATVERKFGHPFDMTPYATLWIAANHMPHTRDFSDAVFRRALVLKFNARFSPDMEGFDPHLSGKLRAELPGILNLALKAYARATKEGFTISESSKQAGDEWRLEADQVRQFVEEVCERDHAGVVPVGVLYDSYSSWAIECGISKKLTMRSFRNRLTMAGFGSTRTAKARLVTGIAIRQHRGDSSDYLRLARG